MKKILNKIDRFILDQLTTYTKKWIKKHDFKKHKIDLTINVQKIRTGAVFLLAMLIPAITFAAVGRYWNAGFHALVWSISVGIGMIQLNRSITVRKPQHDILFSLRKNPEVYEMEKAVLEHVFVATKKSRVSFAIFDFSISWFFATSLFLIYYFVPTPEPYLSLALYFVIAPFLSTAEQYLFFVFDFDEPEEKKKVKESISEIVLKAWQNLIGGLAPQPNYG